MKYFVQTLSIVALLVFLLSSESAWSQSVLDQLESGSTIDSNYDLPSMATERIEAISPSKRIFVISNSNNSFGKGDFITLVRGNSLATRALVAKITDDGRAGIKILKIYNLDLWNTMGIGSEIQVLRGDDTAFRTAKTQIAEAEDTSQIQDEENLFDEKTFLEDDQTLEENNKRIIKTDNIISIGYGQISSINNDGSSQGYGQLNASWAYQVTDNIWAEALYGQNVINDFPANGLDTRLSNFTFRIKYTIEAPFYSYVKPYVGYQYISAESPGAGVADENNQDTAQLDRELVLVDDSGKSGPVFGVTLLKRLVPGWFAKVDLGNDIIGLGAALEF